VNDVLPQDLEFGPRPSAAPDHPQVLMRVIVTPPGAPWEQARAAGLDAQHGAPLPIAELIHRLKRLTSWAPGRPGRFAVFYVRAKEFRAPFETRVDVDGQSVRVAFGVVGDGARRLQGGLMLLAMLVATGAILGGALTLAGRARSEASARLDAAERMAAAKLTVAETYRKQAAETRALRTAAGRARPVAEVIDDLTWLATSKTPEARIAAVHWQAGVMAVEVRGDPPPFAVADRSILRSPKQLRPGVWLWGVGAGGSAQASTKVAP
jgi:hypothetical protein